MEALLRKYGELIKKSKEQNKGYGDNQLGELSFLKIPASLECPQNNQDQERLELVQTNHEDLNSTDNLHELISYKIQGSDHLSYVSDLYLQQRRKILAEDVRIMINKEQKNSEKRLVSVQKKQRSRYFQSNIQENKFRYARCFRCGQKGHSIKYCPQQFQPVKCLYCLGNHKQSNCNAKSCFQCNQMGHIAKQCPAAKGKCSKCGFKGHNQENCGIRLDRCFREKYGDKDILGLRCLADCKYPVGHFNCHQYEKVREKCYSQCTVEKTIEREKFILANLHKLRQFYFKSKPILMKQNQKSPSDSFPQSSTQSEQQRDIQCDMQNEQIQIS